LGQCRERGRRLAAEEGLSCGKLCYYVLVADAKSPQRALWLQGLMSVELGVRLGVGVKVAHGNRRDGQNPSLELPGRQRGRSRQKGSALTFASMMGRWELSGSVGEVVLTAMAAE
jgi:hypothetical protein